MMGLASRACLSLIITVCFFSVQGNEKGLIVSTDWSSVENHAGEIQVFHGDPSGYTRSQVVGHTKIDISEYSSVYSIIAYTRNDSFLFLDGNDNTIHYYENFNLHLNDTNAKITSIRSGVFPKADQLAVDWVAGNVYWCDAYNKWIATHPLKFDTDESVYKVLVKDDVTEPLAIGIDGNERLMFYSDYDGSSSKLVKATLLGEDRDVIVHKSTNALYVSSISVDIDQRKIYWVDTLRQTIEYCDYEGTNRNLFRRNLRASISDIAVSTSVVCANDYPNKDLVCFRKSGASISWYKDYATMNVNPLTLAVYDSTLQPIINNPCATKNCEHFCFNVGPTKAKCSCKEGYVLNNDGRTCTSENGLLYGKALLVANSTTVCMYDITAITDPKKLEKHTCSITGLTDLVYFAVDSHTATMYYTDHTTVRKVDMITNAETDLFSESADSISGLTFDWNSKNLFWSNYYDSQIGDYSMTSGTKSYLFSGRLFYPVSVTVNPFTRMLYWLEGYGYSMYIEQGRTNGTDLSTLTRSLVYYATILLYDPISDRLYYLNGGTSIYSVNTNGTDTQYYMYTGTSNSFQVYKNLFVWEYDDALEAGYRYNIMHNTPMNMSSIMAVGLYEKDVQLLVKSECSYFNGGCQHECQPTDNPKVVTCLCEVGYKLGTDGKSCTTEPFDDNFAFITELTHHKVYQVSLSDGELRTLDIPEIHGPVSVLIDPQKNNLYWTNAYTTDIKVSAWGSGIVDRLYYTAGVLPIGLALDQSSGLLYYSTQEWQGPSYIGVFHAHVAKHRTLISNLGTPKGLAVYPSKGVLFYAHATTDNETIAYIGRANMDGTNNTKIVTGNISFPVGLVIDYSTDRIYWADARVSKIESCNLDGSDRKFILQEQGAGIVGLDIDVSARYLYYIGHNKQQISKYNLVSKQIEQFMPDRPELGRIESIKVYPEQSQPGNVHCQQNNGGCALFCFPTATGRTCGCEDNKKLLSDKRSCEGHVSCTEKIPNAILEDRCIAHADGSCDYTCADGYEKTRDKVTCNVTGVWAQNAKTYCRSLSGVCPKVLDHGFVSPNCDRTLGSVCTYSCNAGYVTDPQNPVIKCQNGGNWDVSTDKLCKVSTQSCSRDIENGQIVEGHCNLHPGSSCDYTCNSGYQKNSQVKTLVCLSNGKWSYNGVLCLAPKTACDQGISGGSFDSSCTFEEGKSCTYTCDTGYAKNSKIQQVFCLLGGTWNYPTSSLCKRKCSTSILGGKLVNCTALSGEICNYQCNAGYGKQAIVDHLRCDDGTWNMNTDSLCIANVRVGFAAQSQSKGSGVSSGATAGIVLAVIVVTAIILVLIVVILWRRNKPEGKYVNKFERFDDTNVPVDQGVSGFSNPINDPGYEDLSHLQEGGYVEIEAPPSVDPKNIDVKM